MHCPPVMKDATHKLSKRNGDASYQDLVAQGYLKEAILNYILLLGWSPKSEKEIFSLPEMIEAFDIHGISKSPAIFDTVKLRFLNGEYIRALTPEQFHDMALPWIRKACKAGRCGYQAHRCPCCSPAAKFWAIFPSSWTSLTSCPTTPPTSMLSKKMKTNRGDLTGDPASDLCR